MVIERIPVYIVSWYDNVDFKYPYILVRIRKNPNWPRCIEEIGVFLEIEQGTIEGCYISHPKKIEAILEFIHNREDLSMAETEELKKLLEKFFPVVCDNCGVTIERKEDLNYFYGENLCPDCFELIAFPTEGKDLR